MGFWQIIQVHVHAICTEHVYKYKTHDFLSTEQYFENLPLC